MTTRYVPFTLGQFTEVMDGIGFATIDIEGTEEYVFERQVERRIKNGEGPEAKPDMRCTYPFSVRILSTVDKRTNETREKDSDAIRLLLVSQKTNRPIKIERRVFRTKSAFPNTIERARELFKFCVNNLCARCKQGVMVRRKGRQGEFYGCSAYPECKHTKEASDVSS